MDVAGVSWSFESPNEMKKTGLATSMCVILEVCKRDNEGMNFVTLLMVEIHTFHVQDMTI